MIASEALYDFSSSAPRVDGLDTADGRRKKMDALNADSCRDFALNTFFMTADELMNFYRKRGIIV